MRWPDGDARLHGRSFRGRGFGRRTTVAVAAALALVRAVAGALPALAASPSPSAMPGGDPRSSGQGPGLVGDPLLAIGLVMLIALIALGATLAYVRVTGGPRRT